MKQAMLVSFLATGAVYNFVASLGAAVDGEFLRFLSHVALVTVLTGFALDTLFDAAIERLVACVDVLVETVTEDGDDA